MSRRLALSIEALAVAGAAFLAFPALAAAATFQVTSTLDRVDDNIGNGVCHAAGLPAGHDCTLRAAVQEANATAAPDTISLPGGTLLSPTVYQLAIAGAGEDAAATGDLDVTAPLTVNGPTGLRAIIVGSRPIIDGGGLDRVFDVTASGSLTLTNLTVRGGDATPGANSGGGIRASGDVVLSDVALTGNKGYFGGAVYSLKSLAASGTTFSGNSGGAVYDRGTLSLSRTVFTDNVGSGEIVNFGTATISDSTFHDNSSTTLAGITNGGTMTLTTSSVYKNTTSGQFGHGGGIWSNGTLTATNDTIVGNSATTDGGGLRNEGTATLVNDTVAGNAAPSGGNLSSNTAFATTAVNTIFATPASGGDCAGALISKGHNIDDGTSCALSASGDLANTDPLLGPLADNGGPAETEALQPGSPAIDAADSSKCPPTDERGIKRPTGAGCDIGAYEFAVSADLAVTLTATPAQVTLGQPVTITATVLNKGPNTATGTQLTDTLPAAVTVQSLTPSSGSCTTGAAIQCSLGSLADQANATVKLVVLPSTAGLLRDIASVKALQVDPDTSTNSARADVTVSAPQASTGGAAGFTAKIAALHARRIKGRVHLKLVLVLNKPLRVGLNLLRRGKSVAAKTTSVRSGRRVLTLVARRKTGKGRYVLRVALSDGNGHKRTLSLGVSIR